MINFVRQARQQVSNRLIEALTDDYTAIGDEASEVVEPGRCLVELLDSHDVWVTEPNHVEQNQMCVLELTADHHIEQTSEPGASNLGMLVHEGCEK